MNATTQATNPLAFVYSLGIHILLVAILYFGPMINGAFQTEVKQETIYVTVDALPEIEKIKSLTQRKGGAKKEKSHSSPSQVKNSGMNSLLKDALNFSQTPRARVVKSGRPSSDPKASKNLLRGIVVDQKTQEKLEGHSGQIGQGYDIDWKNVKIVVSEGGNADLSLSAADQKKIRELIVRKNAQFRECYEKALLIDHHMRGHLSFKFNVGQNTQLDFNGKGNSESQGSLKSCVQRVNQSIRFPSQYVGKTFLFSLTLRT